MKTLIIGGGLSGLALASALEANGQDYILLEARGRFGGRIKTERFGSGAFDMGPAWFWPGQPRIAALIKRLGLEKFDQFSQGAITLEDENGDIQRGRGFASMQGSWRLQGGFVTLIDALANDVPDTRKRLNCAVTGLTQTATGIRATFLNAATINADRVVLSLPPRIAANLTYTPALPELSIQSMRAIPTWMAGQAKVVAAYNSPFWRAAGLSGDAQSRVGPMIEVHDASPAVGGPYALFGFIGVAPASRGDEETLRHHILAQLTRLFGPEGAKPEALFIKDWAFDPHTSTKEDNAPLYAHPTYGLPQTLNGPWDGRLYFSGTEVAAQFGGFIEGALESAETVFRKLVQKIEE